MSSYTTFYTRLKMMLLCSVLAIHAHAAVNDSLVIVTNKTLFQQGDTLSFDVYLPKVAEMELQAATLNVWIEDVNKYHQWKFRFPLVNGRMSADIAIAGTIPDGKYAVNFLVQRGLWKLNGTVKNIDRKQDSLMCFLRTKTASSGEVVKVMDNGYFHLANQVFEDTGRLIFTPISTKKVMSNNLNINLVTPLDSAFVPVLSSTKLILVGNQPNVAAADVNSVGNTKYSFEASKFTSDHMLEEVVVKSDRKKEVDKYADQYVSGLFKGGQARIFDGLEDQTMSTFPDIFTYLQGKVGGLTIGPGKTGGYSVSWRGSATDFYLDEMPIDADQLQAMNPADIAMIKVFNPPAFLLGNANSAGGAGGAIAVYTKKGMYSRGGMTDNTVHKYYFLVFGYNPLNAVWK